MIRKPTFLREQKKFFNCQLIRKKEYTECNLKVSKHLSNQFKDHLHNKATTLITITPPSASGKLSLELMGMINYWKVTKEYNLSEK